MTIKRLISFCVVFLIFLPLSFAKNVSLNEAQIVALNFYKQRNILFNINQKVENISVSDYHINGEKSEPLYYIFNFSNNGYVIVAGDDIVYPIIGYSFEGKFQIQNHIPALEAMLIDFSDMLAHQKSIKAQPNNKVRQAWKEYKKRNFKNIKINKSAKAINPLLTCKWNQNTNYNSQCPIHPTGPGGHCYAGCVATAMAQIMYYYKFPTQGVGSHSYNHPNYGAISVDFSSATYDYSIMTDVLNGSSKNEIAKLIYHCGVGVDMYYQPNGSSSNSIKALSAFESYFNFSVAANILNRDDFQNDIWDSILRENLDLLKPIYYSGSNSTVGHAFVCDGYQGSDFFHFNWGWSGSNNGFFYLNNIDFKFGQKAIVNLAPYNYPYCIGSRTFTTPSRNISDGSGISKYWNNTDCEWLIKPPDADKIQLQFSFFKTELNKDIVTVYDGEDATAPILGTFSGQTIPPTIMSSGVKMFITFKTDSANNDFGWQAHYNSITYGIEDLKTISDINIYPNPANDNLNIVYSNIPGQKSNIEIIDITGKVIFRELIETNKSEINRQIDVSNFSSGIYLLKISNSKKFTTKRVIINN